MTNTTTTSPDLWKMLLDNGMSFFLLAIAVYILWRDRQQLVNKVDTLQAAQNDLRERVITESFEREEQYAQVIRDLNVNLEKIFQKIN